MRVGASAQPRTPSLFACLFICLFVCRSFCRRRRRRRRSRLHCLVLIAQLDARARVLVRVYVFVVCASAACGHAVAVGRRRCRWLRGRCGIHSERSFGSHRLSSAHRFGPNAHTHARARKTSSSVKRQDKHNNNNNTASSKVSALYARGTNGTSARLCVCRAHMTL